MESPVDVSRAEQRFYGEAGTKTRVSLRVGQSYFFVDETEVVVDENGVTVHTESSHSWWPHGVIESVTIQPADARY